MANEWWVRRSVRSMAMALCALALVGCVNTPLPDYYVLTPQRGQLARPQADMAALALGVGPITIPETLNRPNIVTPRDLNQMEVAEYHRWSEPLRENISRVLMTNLADRMGVVKLYAYPWLGNQLDYQLRLDVMQMLGSPGREAYLQVRWQVLAGGKPAKLLQTRIDEYRVLPAADGYSALVGAFSELLSQFSDDVAIELTALVGGGAKVALDGLRDR